ncbi:MAG: hypothetical protein N2V78_00910 [Methanophagales archaeon]|nr:hypothetical protein [Methanophagales archaeon]
MTDINQSPCECHADDFAGRIERSCSEGSRLKQSGEGERLPCEGDG